MAKQPPPPPPPPAPREKGNRGAGGSGLTGGLPKWSIWLLVGLFLTAFLLPSLFSSEDGTELSYTEFREKVIDDKVESIEINNNNGQITGKLVDSGDSEGEKFKTTGVLESGGVPERDLDLLEEHDVQVKYKTPESSFFESILPLLLIAGLFFLFIWWMQRRAQGQMSGIMSIGRSKAKTYSTESPSTTFDDVAGYDGVKQEITEVIDFLKEPQRFAQIGARIPKGVLLVGPPGTGKTLIARAVAGEAGVPFMSVTGSDFMEMFVGVGASRVRDLFESAKKAGKAIIFIDEIDSIGRKRGAGLGGGHDEREQTLNQLLSEMDGFEATEGVVMLAATNRPDILDPALLRAGRFDRQVMVPLPEMDERKAILKVHTKGKKIAEDVDLDLVARGTPGMSGADLANLVNEAALFAVRGGFDEIHNQHFDEARDRILMGQRRDSMGLTDEEKEMTAYHEAGHAICSTLLPYADRLHKVTIIPTGRALGVTQTLPEERHTISRAHLEDRIAMAMGGRVAERIVFDHQTSGASDDLVRSTQVARSMVRELGMSDQIGPMAWGDNQQVFLGDDLMHSRDYSDDTARVIDEEVGKILRSAEKRAHELLVENRKGLDLVARALLEVETVEGKEVERLIELGRSDSADQTPSEEPSSNDDTSEEAASEGETTSDEAASDDEDGSSSEDVDVHIGAD